jgi:hypothetical protein
MVLAKGLLLSFAAKRKLLVLGIAWLWDSGLVV